MFSLQTIPSAAWQAETWPGPALSVQDSLSWDQYNHTRDRGSTTTMLGKAAA